MHSGARIATVPPDMSAERKWLLRNDEMRTFVLSLPECATTVKDYL